jgi:predicted P-loop ATPase
MVALRRDSALSAAFAFDEMARRVTITRALPIASGATAIAGEDWPRPMTDVDITRVQELLQTRGLPKLPWETVGRAADYRARENAFHPVRNMLQSLSWDEHPRVGTWLTYYVGAEDTPYVREIGKMFLIALVARVFRPGCKADYMVVLEGPQGIGKSRSCAILGGQWFSDALPDIRERKEASHHLRGVWLCEIAELSAIRRAEVEPLKAFLSRQVERFRPAYGREEVVEPRQCLFIATTNATAYLNDDTGARRFWPVKVGSIDCEALAHDRDQLLAEAVHLFESGERWFPAAEFEAAHIRPEQEARFEEDPWLETVKAHVAAVGKVRVSDVAVDALFLERKAIGTTVQRRIGSILRGLGFTPRRDSSGRWYVRAGEVVTHDAL